MFMKTIIISRTDKIGDVILTLPLAFLLKEKFTDTRIIFLGNSYTKPVLKCTEYIDEIYEWDKITHLSEKERIDFFKKLKADAILHVFPQKEIAQTAFRSGIPFRAGTSHRTFHWLYCNTLLNFSRKKSDLHEAQLNLKLLRPLGLNIERSLEDLSQIKLLNNIPAHDALTATYIDETRINIIFHPRSKGSAREWPLQHYAELCNLLPENKYNIIFSGTEDEAQMYRSFFKNISKNILDAGGKLSLDQYIALISKCDALIAASTGPLHIAAATGIHAFGIYPPIRPMHPGRWAPIGKHVHIFSQNKDCVNCRKTTECQCMKDILPENLKISIESTDFTK